MSVDQKTVRKIGRLARLDLKEEAVPALEKELNAILQFVETLNEVDVEGVEPMTSVVPMQIKMRDDGVTDGNIQSDILANAPASDDGYFLVPKVVE